MAICVVTATGCTEAADTNSKTTPPTSPAQPVKGYLPKDALPDGVALLPPPPAVGSAALAFDEAVAAASLKLRGTPRWDLAAADAEVQFSRGADTFSCALDAPITEQDTPHLYKLLQRAMLDAGKSTTTTKSHYQRRRPFLVNEQPICTPDEIDAYINNGAYPSGHAAVGWAWALILAELAPEQSEAILARGLAFGDSRIVCNLHWHSDVEQGRILAAATLARLHAEPEFLADLAAARQELATARVRKLTPTRDCELETKALTDTQSLLAR